MNAEAEDIVRGYFQAIESNVPASELERFLHDGIRQYEYPSRLNPQGRARDKAAMLADFERGKDLIAKQSYRIRSLVSDGNRVCAETEWTGTLAVTVGARLHPSVLGMKKALPDGRAFGVRPIRNPFTSSWRRPRERRP